MSWNGMIGSGRRLPGLAIVSLLLLTLLAGCGTLPEGRLWGQDATLRPGWQRVEQAAARAALSPATWAPLAGAAVFWAGDLDDNVSDWAAGHTPVFGSRNGAEHASDYLLGATAAAYAVTAAATPGGDQPGDWLQAKVRGGAVGGAAVLAAGGSTLLLKSLVGRTRPDESDSESFPSLHSTGAAVFATLASRNLEYLPLSAGQRTTARFGLAALTAGTAWARVEAEQHYPSDVLVGAALGHFFGAFISDAFLGPDSTVAFQPDIGLQEKKVVFCLQLAY